MTIFKAPGKKIRKCIFIGGLLFFCPPQVYGDEAPDKSSTVYDRTIEELQSPLTAPAKYYVYTGTAITLTLIALGKNHVVDETQEEILEGKVLGEKAVFFDRMGETVPNLIYTLGQLGYGSLLGDDRALLRSEMMFKASVYTALVTAALKFVVHEERPDKADHWSFPSGHTSSIFAFASVVAMEHGWFWGTASFTLASLVAYSRMNDNRHYLHDVLAGATIGLGFGMGIHYVLSKSHSTEENKNENTSYDVLPIPDGAMAIFRYDF